jgi:protein-S-isoprenylcysteine O-methyltransferase Ste14
MKQETIDVLGYTVNGLSIAVFFYLASVLDVASLPLAVAYLAWAVLGFGLVLVAVSTATLITNRETGLIDRGIYGLVRHPMYLGAMLMFLSWILFLPHWTIVLISCSDVAIVYWFMLKGERQNITKFGDAYRRYMVRVPRMNLLAGLLNLLQE